MAQECICSICKKTFTSDEPAVLAISGYGNARYICDECEALLDTATLGTDTDEVGKAIGRLGAYAENLNINDEVVFGSVSALLGEANTRLTKILAGTYDFEEDTSSEDSFDEIPEELRESEEDRRLDEEEALAKAKSDKFVTWFSAIAFAGALIYFVISSILRYV